MAWISKTLGWLRVCTAAPKPQVPRERAGLCCLAEGSVYRGTGSGAATWPRGLGFVKQAKDIGLWAWWGLGRLLLWNPHPGRADRPCSSEPVDQQDLQVLLSLCSSKLHGHQEGNISRRIKFQ